MIREERELLAELARLNRSMASLALRIMDGSASAAEQVDYARRLIAVVPAQPEPEDRADGRGTFSGWGMPRRVRVKASGGETATVVVRVVQGCVWLSVSPPFTWEAVMTPGIVDEVVGVLEVAKEEAEQMGTAAHGRRAGNAGGGMSRRE